MGNKIFSFSQIVKDRDTVEIDGAEYQLLSMDDLGPFQQAKVSLYYKKLEALNDFENINAEDLELAEEAFENFLLMTVKGLAKETLDSLEGSEKWKLFELFSEAAKKKQEQEPKQTVVKALPRNTKKA